MSRILMKPLQQEGEEVLRCAHEKIWPPPQLHLIPKPYGTDVEYLRFRIPDEIYLKVKTWQGVCGLTQMEPQKCSSCPHLLRGSELPQPPRHGLRPASVRVSPIAKTKARLEKKG